MTDLVKIAREILDSKNVDALVLYMKVMENLRPILESYLKAIEIIDDFVEHQTRTDFGAPIVLASTMDRARTFLNSVAEGE